MWTPHLRSQGWLAVRSSAAGYLALHMIACASVVRSCLELAQLPLHDLPARSAFGIVIVAFLQIDALSLRSHRAHAPAFTCMPAILAGC